MTEKKLRRLTIGVYAGVSAILFGASVAFSCLYWDSSKKLENVQADLGEIHAVKAALEETNEELLSANEELNSQNESLRNNVDALSETSRQTEKELADTLAQLDEKTAEEERLNGELKKKQSEKDADTEVISGLQQQLESVTSEKEGLEDQVAELEKRDSSKNKTLARWRDLNNALSDNLADANDQLEAKNDELEAKNDELETANERIEELENTPPTVVYLPAATPEPQPEPAPQPEPVSTPVQTAAAAAGTPEAELMTLFQYGAPLKWARDGAGGFVKVYPKLAYCYLDLTTGDEVSYNADEVLYSASLIKAPYIYTVLREIEAFEAGEHERDENGRIIYKPGEEKYDLSEIWTYDPASMYEEGSGVIVEEQAGFQLTWKELIEYALLYSDNVAFAQTRQRFGYSSFYQAVSELGIAGTASGFMNLSARDCAKFLKDMYGFFETGGELAAMMKADMARSRHPEMIVSHYPAGMASHKYGWDIGAFHDMAIVFDEKPYAIVIMTDYEDGGDEPVGFFGNAVELTKRIHAEKN